MARTASVRSRSSSSRRASVRGAIVRDAGRPVGGAEPFRPKMSAADARSAVANRVGARVLLADFRPTITPLTTQERELVGTHEQYDKIDAQTI